MDLLVPGEAKFESELLAFGRERPAIGATALPEPGNDESSGVVGRQGLDEAAPEAASLMGGVIPPGLTLTLTNDPSLAIQTQNTARLWTGEITFPLTPGAMPPPDAPARTPTPRR